MKANKMKLASFVLASSLGFGAQAFAHTVVGVGSAVTNGGNCDSEPITNAYNKAYASAQAQCYGATTQIGKPSVTEAVEREHFFTCGEQTRTTVTINFSCSEK